MMSFSKGHYRVDLVFGGRGLEHTTALRQTCFPKDALKGDAFDDLSTHFIVTDLRSRSAVASLRMMEFGGGHDIHKSYSAQFYDLERLARYPDPLIEIGRFCLCPDSRDWEAFRAIWGALTAYVDQNNISMLFGCSSFEGVGTSPYVDGFALLASRYLAPKDLAPRKKAFEVIPYAQEAGSLRDISTALFQLPPLLRMYVSMGGWVSDHAVVDRDLDTLHVFTGLEVAAIPDARKRVLRSVFAHP